MNRQFELRHIRGTFLIAGAIAALAFVVAALQASLPTAVGEPAGAVGNHVGEADASVIEAIDREARAAFTEGRAWKSREIGEDGSAAQGQIGIVPGTLMEDALSLRSYFEADHSAGDGAQIPLGRSWKADEIGTGGAASERAETVKTGEVMSLGRQYRLPEDSRSVRPSSPVERGWKPDEIGGAGQVNVDNQPQFSLNENALSLGSVWVGLGDALEGVPSPSVRGMQDKLERILAAEAVTPGALQVRESCGPTSPFGPQPC